MIKTKSSPWKIFGQPGLRVLFSVTLLQRHEEMAFGERSITNFCLLLRFHYPGCRIALRFHYLWVSMSKPVKERFQQVKKTQSARTELDAWFHLDTFAAEGLRAPTHTHTHANRAREQRGWTLSEQRVFSEGIIIRAPMRSSSLLIDSRLPAGRMREFPGRLLSITDINVTARRQRRHSEATA